ncbi:DUF5017 domain-containing protein [Flavobacterium sp. AS60]|uniref:choice-of-anchor J domain-containing protein n=1 Tax=Flavobacterium anseongense TaxID=2910677 RepID=UPI001F41AC9C|nr:choice-of-anchor J domain-containing protein [Flavobacterium sp. AS60]MCF6129876.1 DUF5017 domain-containing protein [Flavobacterium sp. AS60]
MKKISLYSFIAIVALVFTGCTDESDIDNIQTKRTLFVEDFSDNTDNTPLDTPGWTNYAQIGTRKFTEQTFYENGYAEFTSFGSGQALNVAWLISPAFNMDEQEGETLVFHIAQAFLTNPLENTIELMVSTDYDGDIANFNQASWINIPIKTPTPNDDYYENVSSGEVDLSHFTGTLHFAFKAKGSGTNNALDATFQIDNIRLFY